MDARNYAQRYQAAQVNSVDNRRLLLLVFDGGLKFLGRAREALDADDLVRFGESLSRARAIIAELLATLNFQAGGTIARDLARLYEFMLHHLAEASAQRSRRHVDEVAKVFGVVVAAYREILERPADAPAPAAS
jgi:flagellar protein FliS